jgi:hypothetical protein
LAREALYQKLLGACGYPRECAECIPQCPIRTILDASESGKITKEAAISFAINSGKVVDATVFFAGSEEGAVDILYRTALAYVEHLSNENMVITENGFVGSGKWKSRLD